MSDLEKLLRKYEWSSNDSNDQFTVENPATGEIIALIQGGGEKEIDAAVNAANAAYESGWRYTTPEERSRYMLKAADVLEEHLNEIAAIETQENGKPISQSRGDVLAMIGLFRYFGSLIDKLPGEHLDQGLLIDNIISEPLGVVAAIIPFNWPPIHTGGKLAPALATGNTVVLKPGEQAPLTPIRIVELLQTVFPKNVVNVVPGKGAVAGNALTVHPLVRKISFTGSTLAGRSVLRSAAGNITPALLELGGKNAFIVFDDADVELAVNNAFEGGYYNQGESCTASSRLLVQEGIYDEFTKKLTEKVKAIKVGDGSVEGTQIGPMVTAVHQEKVQSYIDLGIEEGLTLAAQGQLPSDERLKSGFFVSPTLFTDVPASSKLFIDEIFGAVVTVTPFKTEEEAISLNNSSEYGLVTGVFTKDYEKAFRIARKVDVGIVLINSYNRRSHGMPFGGAKHSGYGREHSIETLKEFTRRKTIRFPSGQGKEKNWPNVDDVFNKK
nr:aldehyde dehydrogenase family protein [uncultured Chryseobacterium sp.]